MDALASMLWCCIEPGRFGGSANANGNSYWPKFSTPPPGGTSGSRTCETGARERTFNPEVRAGRALAGCLCKGRVCSALPPRRAATLPAMLLLCAAQCPRLTPLASLGLAPCAAAGKGGEALSLCAPVGPHPCAPVGPHLDGLFVVAGHLHIVAHGVAVHAAEPRRLQCVCECGAAAVGAQTGVQQCGRCGPTARAHEGCCVPLATPSRVSPPLG